MFATGYFDQYQMPVEWQVSLESIAPNFLDVFDQQQVTPTEDWKETFARTLSIVAMTETQRRLMNIQLDRAKAGLPPLKASEYSPGVQLDIGLEKAIVIGGGMLLLGYFLLKKGR